MIDLIANEILIAGHLMQTNVVSNIAKELGYRPMLIVTALYKGTESGKMKYNKKADTVMPGDDVDFEHLAITEPLTELLELVEQFMFYMNKDEVDMTTDEVLMFLGGIPELHIKMVVFKSDKLTSYELKDPKDKKSVYTFITLKENADKQWGKKQFKDTKKKK